VIGIVLVAHVPLASALRECARHVLGDIPAFVACDIKADEDPGQAARHVNALIADVDRGSGVLVLTDLKGASPSNIAAMARKTYLDAGHRCELLAGMNACMLLRALTNRSRTLDEARDCALLGGIQGVVRVD